MHIFALIFSLMECGGIDQKRYGITEQFARYMEPPQQVLLPTSRHNHHDHRMTSILNRNHYGWLQHSLAPSALLTSLLSFLTFPQSLVVHLDFFRSALNMETAWMWHVGGVGETPADKAISRLYWQVYEVKNKGVEKKAA